MNQETSIAQTISAAESAYGGRSDKKASTAYDAAIKKLLAHKPFLAYIMKACMPEYSECSVEEIANQYIEGDPHYDRIHVDEDMTNPSLDAAEKNDSISNERIEGGNNESTTMTEGDIRYDIRFNALLPKDDDLVGVIVNVEAQNDADVEYPILKRAIYYCSRLISAQKNKVFRKSEYGKIKKVYSIWVLANAEKGKENTITAYNITEQAIKGSAVDADKSYDLLCAVLIRLNDLPMLDNGKVDEGALERDVIGMLDVLLKGQLAPDQRKELLEKHYGIEMTEQIEEEVGQMCNLSKGIMEQGRVEGREEGRAEGVLDVIKNMIAMGLPTAVIAAAAKKPEAYIEQIRADIAPAVG